MQIIISKDQTSWVKDTADEITAQVKKNPASRLSFATGVTTLPLFDELVKRSTAGEIDLSHVNIFQLDEYRGLNKDHPASCAFTLINRFYQPANLPAENCHLLDGLCDDPEQFCRSYETLIEEGGGIDLQVLGIGLNGHIGFNQPGTPFSAQTHPARVDDHTWEKNLKFFENPDDNPRDALTMGIATIMASKRIILLATGFGKKDILCKALFGPVTPEVPASILQNHPDVLVILDYSLKKLCSQ